MMRRASLGLLVLTLSAGCVTRGRSGTAAPQEDVDFAQRYLALFSSRSFPAIEMGMDPALKDPQIRLKLLGMASVFPREQPTAIRLVFSQLTRTGDATSSSLSFQYDYPNRWVRADVVVGRTGQAPVVKGVHIQPLTEPLERTHRITLAGKGAAHYLALAASLLVTLLVAYTFVLAIRAPLGPLRWVWAGFVLLGVVQFIFNWTTGRFTVVPMSMQMFVTGFSRASPYAPFLITTSLPVGAIVFLIQRREWLRRPPDEQDDDEYEPRPGERDGGSPHRPPPVAVRADRDPADLHASATAVLEAPRDRSDNR